MNYIKTAIKGINNELKPLQEQVKKILQAKRALQDVCEHDWKLDWEEYHGSCGQHYECNICEKTKVE